jgi:hypothetical protein
MKVRKTFFSTSELGKQVYLSEALIGWSTKWMLGCLALVMLNLPLYAQTSTTSSMDGIVLDEDDLPLPGAHVVAIHLPTNTQYSVVTFDDGRFRIPAMRVGGPYEVTVSYIGYENRVIENIQLRLGQNYSLPVVMYEGGISLDAVTVSSRIGVINENRMGASSNISTEALEGMPTLSRSIQDFTRFTPQSSGTSFAGQDPKAINFTVDGAILTNTFGLSGSVPGASTNSTPISLDAIKEIQVNISPYDVTQGGFTGAGINAVTRSGDNEIRGSVFFNTRNQSLVGRSARGTEVISDEFTVSQVGFRLGGPIIKDKLFFFVSGELERRNDPGTSFVSDDGQEGANVTRVRTEDLQQLRNTLIDRFGYDPGGWQGYSLPTNSYKIFAKIDYNINDRHSLSVRYNMMESSQGRLNARTSLGFGGRNANLFSMNFQNSNYLLNDNFYSGIMELNSRFGSRYFNSLTVGYTSQQNFRSWEGGDFPAVDILEGGRNYISFGTDLLSPNRALSSGIFQFQNNFKVYLASHSLTMGVNFEAFQFDYTFNPTYFGQYVYNSLDDFYRDINGETVELRRFQRTFSGLPGGGVPTANTQAYIASAYVQDEWDITNNFRLIAGVRLDVPFYGDSAPRNQAVEELTFNRPNGEPFSIRTDRLPDTQFQINPRAGFNWNVLGDRSFQIRGGSGLFTGRPIYINVSNMINSNGLTLGQIRGDNTTEFPFSPDVNAHVPEEIGEPESFDLAYIEPSFRNPQVWRSNVGIDKTLFWGLIGSVEAVYTRQMSDIIFYESNLRAPQATMGGPDNRPLYGFTDEANRINPNVTNATVMANTREGYSYSFTGQLTKEFSKGFSLMAAYNYAVAKNMADGNTQHFLSYENIHSVQGGNFPQLSFSLDDQRHRVITMMSYSKSYAKNRMSSSFSLFYELGNQGVFSYVYAGDANGDLVAGNDLIYVPTSQEIAQMRFRELTVNGQVFTESDQQGIFDNLIEQSNHLSGRRGDYAQRHGGHLPLTGRIDFSFQQNFNLKVKEKTNTLQLRLDIINLTNLLNSNWGVGYIPINDTPLAVVDFEGNNVPVYQLVPVRGEFPTGSYRRTANILDVWQMQVGVRYIFN